MGAGTICLLFCQNLYSVLGLLPRVPGQALTSEQHRGVSLEAPDLLSGGELWSPLP